MSILATLAAGRVRLGRGARPHRAVRRDPGHPPPQFAQTATFELEELSRYDDRGPAWYWNNFRTGEHTGTHFDAPNHWVTGQDGDDVASVPARRLIGPPSSSTSRPRSPRTPTSCSRSSTSVKWESTHGPLPEGGWLLFRTGWDARSSCSRTSSTPTTPGRTPGMSPACARWLAEEAPVVGLGVETVGTDAGAAHSFDPPFPCHSSWAAASTA